MTIRRVSLFEFMPYGAPELLQSSSPFLARAVLTGALAWSAAFAVLVVTGVLRVGTVPIEPPRVVVDVMTYEHEPLPPLAPKHPAAATKPTPTSDLPVSSDPAAAVDPHTAPIGGDQDSPVGTLPPALPGTGVVEPVVPVIPQDDRTYQQHEVEQLPEVLAAPRPTYPPFAREAQVEGRVLVRVLVDRDGSVARVEIARSIPLLDQAAIEAARTWKFTPARVAGRPVAVWVLIPFHFRLH